MKQNLTASQDSVVEAGARSEIRSDRGAVGTEMAIVVAIVVGIALALGAVMISSAQSHQNCIPATAGASVGAGCP